jgi:asparagine synthase (glutamine-hydrolysing)
MNVVFGRWNFEGRAPSSDCLEQGNATLAAYGPDGCETYSKDGVNIVCHAFHTTGESAERTQPLVTQSGNVVVWDGRLDNRKELLAQFRDCLSDDSDVSIAAAAFERSGTSCFQRLLGDWVLTIWNPTDRSLILAKDPIGPRQLYYTLDTDDLTWSTVLDPLVLSGTQAFALDKEYMAGWLSFFPASHLTPYVGIASVPPSSYIYFQKKNRTITKYWDFDPVKQIRYKTDAEYEEHFRSVFEEAVRRRLRSHAPILAELSGGMDSSSIVCMADIVIARGDVETPRLDTLSYYDDSETSWNEYPYFTKVEEKRGHVGCHINVSQQNAFQFSIDTASFAATPASGRSTNLASRRFSECVNTHGNRVVLSGVGGDEVTGGVPTPTPELADLLAKAQFGILRRQLTIWALTKRQPWLHLLWNAVRGFLPSAVVGEPQDLRPAPWLSPHFTRDHCRALSGYRPRLKLFGPKPSFQENQLALDMLRRQLACLTLSCDPVYEKSFPYLDRDLLEFLYSVPRDQLVRPGQRRSLMRRSLVGIVPLEILNRPRKAFIARAPTAAISAQWADAIELTQQMVSGSLGIVIPEQFVAALEKARVGREIPMIPLLRTIALELWLRNMFRERRLKITEDQTPSVAPAQLNGESTLVSR